MNIHFYMRYFTLITILFLALRQKKFDIFMHFYEVLIFFIFKTFPQLSFV